jgi:serine protease Do
MDKNKKIEHIPNPSEWTDLFSSMVSRVHHSLVIVRNGGRGAGAGIIWRSDGLILTNNHVLGRGHPVVTLADDREYEARLVNRDPEIDMALLEIEAPNLTPAVIGDSTALSVGTLTFAIGHPWGLRGSVTAGVISHMTTATTNGTKGIVPVIRTDATLAPGNSGGPLVNTTGEVVGINTMIVGGDQGVAIPAAVAMDFVSQSIASDEDWDDLPNDERDFSTNSPEVVI